MIIHKQILYFCIALIPVLIQPDSAPGDAWCWFKWSGTSLLAGLIALKALQSDPNVPN